MVSLHFNLTEQEFFDTMKDKRVKRIKDIDLPVHPKKFPNREATVPFVEQLIQKKRNEKDPRMTGEDRYER